MLRKRGKNGDYVTGMTVAVGQPKKLRLARTQVQNETQLAACISTTLLQEINASWVYSGVKHKARAHVRLHK